MFAIQARGVSKRYDLYRHPADRIKELLWPGRRSFHEEVWALRDLDLEIPRGTTWGVIGSNGAGKSTLLKLFTGTTRPTRGALEVNGTVSGILELGQGFDPEFSGRSNALMNCSILGMSRSEALKRLGSIVEFAELGEVIDHPVRTYSSGMYLRLAFAVATSVDPDILVVDEALSVGDEYFRGKCYQRINDLRRRGSTILFVSHALGEVRSLCDRVILLREGRIEASGSPEQVSDAYLNMVHEQSEARLRQANRRSAQHGRPRWGSGAIQVEDVRCLGGSGDLRFVFGPGDPMLVEAHYRVLAYVKCPVFGVGIFRSDGTYLSGVNHLWHPAPLELGPFHVGRTGRVRCHIDSLPLLKGSYYISWYCYDHAPVIPVPLDHLERVCTFEVTEGAVEMHGMLMLPTRWEVG